MNPLDSTLAGLPALSIRQPWAWLILNGGKDIENRKWPTRYRGKFLIHAAKGCTQNEFEDAILWMLLQGIDQETLPTYEGLQRGGIVGEADIVDCVRESSSPWFVGSYGFVLRNVRPIPFIPCRGALGFFRPEVKG